MIDIICYYDDHHETLFNNFFYPTYIKYLNEDFNLIINKKENHHKTTGFETQNWCDIIVERFDLLKKYIIKNPDKWAIFSDIDIIFLNNFITNILECINQDKYNIYYMPEGIDSKINNHYINGGFFLFKCCDDIYNYFDIIENNIKLMEKPNDQVFLHRYLKSNPDCCKHTLLDSNIFLANNYIPKFAIKLIREKKLKVFHATSTWSLLSKIQVLSSAMCVKSLTENIINNEKKSRIWI